MPILDQFGRAYETIEKKPESRTIAAVSIRDRESGYPSNSLTPERLASILREAANGDISRQMELFEEMEEKDTHLSGELLKRKNAVKGLSFDIIPYEEGSRLSAHRDKKNIKSDKVCDFCRDVIFSVTDFEDVLFDLLDAIGKGISLSEIKWGTDGRYFIVEDLVWIHQKKLTFSESLYPRLLTDDDTKGIEIPAFKTIYHRHKARSGHDTRAGMLRVCTWMYLFKNYAIKDWVSFMEVFGMPLRIGKYDAGASEGDKDALIAAIRSIGSDAAGIISKNTEIDFVESVTRSSESPYKVLANFCNAEMSKAIIGGTLTTEAGEKGSYSLGKVHDGVRMDLVISDSKSLATTLRDQLLRPLVGFNFGWDTPVPWFRFTLPKSEDTELLSKVYKNLAEMGQPISQEHVSERFKIPLPGSDETVLNAPVSPKPVGVVKDKMKNTPATEAAGEKIDDLSPAHVLDALFEKTLNSADLGLLIEPLKKMLDSVETLSEFRDGLIDMAGSMDDSDLGDLMQKAFVLADMSGRFDATQR